ncbi:MAG: hypothetical protein FK734_10055 [Asgard group archaeon]|nr:hypothetical protein [Asgard group archaeon]
MVTEQRLHEYGVFLNRRKRLASWAVGIIVLLLTSGCIIASVFYPLLFGFPPEDNKYLIGLIFGILLPILIINVYLLYELNRLRQKNQLFNWLELWSVIFTALAMAMLFIGIGFIISTDTFHNWVYTLCFSLAGSLTLLSIPCWVLYIIRKRKANIKTKS